MILGMVHMHLHKRYASARLSLRRNLWTTTGLFSERQVQQMIRQALLTGASGGVMVALAENTLQVCNYI